ncbi:MAG: hypothetical protein BGO76_00870, partial [Caedibacter sp. 38-128]
MIRIKDSPQIIELDHLENITGIRFTPREIDIISFIISGRPAKKISSLLSLSPKTVENYTRNIMGKVGCNSQDGIRDYIEKASLYPLLRCHYEDLIIANEFKKIIPTIKSLAEKENVSCRIVCDKDYFNKSSLVQKIESFIKLVDINTTHCEAQEIVNPADVIQKADKTREIILYCASKETIVFDVQTVELIHLKHLYNKRVIILLLDGATTSFISNSSKEREYVDFSHPHNFYAAFLNLIEKMLPVTQNLRVVKELQRKTTSQQLDSFNNFSRQTFQTTSNSRINSYTKHFWNIFIAKKLYFLAFCLSVLIILGCGNLFYFRQAAGKIKHQTANKYLSLSQSSLRANLYLPAENVLLHRPYLFSQIDKALKQPGKIQTIALVGPAGAGKTTLARQYAYTQDSSVLWEIDAETKDSLLNSIEALAYSLAKTSEEKKLFKEIQDIKNPKEKEDKILVFIERQFKYYKNWLLIFDNVEQFSEVQKYLPFDPKVWGEGKVIITSRDENIRNNTYISQTILTNELTTNEKYHLFNNITQKERKETSQPEPQVKAFLDHLPPFPLDISIAAYYLKTTNTSYEKYLEHLKENKQEFQTIQENILKDESNYKRTRYSILTVSLKQLLSSHKDFQQLLLLISLLDSQSILRELLDAYKNDLVIDNFLYNLKKFSLITIQGSLSTISIHRSTQELCLQYLNNLLNLQTNKQPIKAIASFLETYATEAINREDFTKIKLLAPHIEKLLSHVNFLQEETKNSLKGILGCIYYYLSYDTRAKDYLESSLNKFVPYNKPLSHARVLSHLGTVYRMLGEYKKAQEVLEQSLLIYNRYLSECDIEKARALGYLSIVYKHLDNFSQAQRTLEESLAIYERHPAMNHVGYARVLGYLGILYRELGEAHKAREALERSVAVYQKHPEHHVGLSWALVHLGNIHRELGNYHEAKKVLEQALQNYKKHYSDQYIDVGWTLVHLGNVYRKLGNYSKARDLLEKALEIHKQNYSSNHIDVGWVLILLGNVCRKMGDFNKARNYLEEGFSIYGSHFAEDNTNIAWVSAFLGNFYKDIKEYKKAMQLLENSLNIYKKHFKPTHDKVAWVSGILGNIYKDIGLYDKAKVLLQHTLSIYEEKFGKEHIETAQTLLSLGELYLATGNLNQAEMHINTALKVFRIHNYPDIHICWEYLINCVSSDNVMIILK